MSVKPAGNDPWHGPDSRLDLSPAFYREPFAVKIGEGNKLLPNQTKELPEICLAEISLKTISSWLNQS
jgi:hypothetical protein